MLSLRVLIFTLLLALPVYGAGSRYAFTNGMEDFGARATCMGGWGLGDSSAEHGSTRCDEAINDHILVNFGTVPVASTPTGSPSWHLSVGCDTSLDDYMKDSSDDNSFDGYTITIGSWVQYDASGVTERTITNGIILHSGTHLIQRNALFNWNQGLIDSTAQTGTTGMVPDVWHFQAMTWDDDGDQKLRMYDSLVSGGNTLLSATSGVIDDPRDETNGDPIGICKYNGIAALEGEIYGAFHFNAVLTDAEICQICRCGLNGDSWDRRNQCNDCAMPTGARCRKVM